MGFFRLVIHKVIHIVKIPRMIQDRHGTYYLRIIVPQRARLIVGKKEIRKTLRTKDPFTARQLAYAFNIWIDQHIMKKPTLADVNLENIRKYDAVFAKDGSVSSVANIRPGEEESVRILVSSVAIVDKAIDAVTAKATSTLFSIAYREYLTERELGNAGSTIDSKEGCYLNFQIDFENPQIHNITHEDALIYKKKQLRRGLARSTINTKMSFMRDFFKWAIENHKYHQPNPFLKLNIKASSATGTSEESWDNYTTDNLKTIFKRDDYLKFMGIKPDYYWLPIVCLYTGARIGEVAGVKISSFITEGGITYFTPYKPKNKSSKRRIPVANQLIELGFLQYVEEVRALKHDQLFFFLPESKNGYGKNCSRRFGEYMNKLGLKSSKLVFQSFRHTSIDLLTNQNTNIGLAMGFVGHVAQDKLPSGVSAKSVHFNNYDHAHSDGKLSALKSVADSIDFAYLFSDYETYVPGVRWLDIMKTDYKPPVRKASIEQRKPRGPSKKA